MYNYTVSFVIPVKNDKRLVDGILKIKRFAIEKFFKYEIIVCGEINQKIENIDFVKLINICPAKKGKCLKAGIANSAGDVIIVCDADIPVSFDDIEMLLSSIDDAEFVTGNRRGTKPIHNEFLRDIASNVFTLLVRKAFSIDYDTQCGIKIFKSKAAKELFHNQIIEGLAYDVEIFIRARHMDYRIIQNNISWLPQSDSTVSLIKSSPLMIIDLFRLLFWKMSNEYKGNFAITTRHS